MRLVRLIAEHLLPSTIIGGLAWWYFGEWQYVVVSLVAGWLIDGDHLLDLGLYLVSSMSCHRKSLLQLVTSGDFFCHNGRVLIVFHGWEWVLSLAIIALCSFSAIWLVAAIAMALHLLIDSCVNGCGWKIYFMTYRVMHGFKTDFLFKG